jgi:glycosyltransferase involved in cell wall biosynthesis
MKLLFVSNLFPDQCEPWRGLDNVTLLHALRQQEPGLDIRVLAFRPALGLPGPAPLLRPRPGDELLSPSYHKAAYLPKFGGWNHRLFALSLAKAKKEALGGFQPEVILAPWLFPDACAAVACFPQVPLVAVAQGSDVHQYLSMPMRRRAILELCDRARGIVTRSQDLRRRLTEAGADGTKVHAIYNGVYPDIFHPAPRQTAREQLQLPISAQGCLVLFVGNFLPVKGIDLLLEAFALVHQRRGDLTLALIGSGPLEHSLKQRAAELGVSDRLLFAGRQPPQVVARWMQAANAVCLSSHNEGVPNVVLEAVSSGRPMVSTDVGGIAEIIEPLMSRRFLVSSRDAAAYAAALTDALDHPPDEQALHQKALHYSWENCAQAYLALLR